MPTMVNPRSLALENANPRLLSAPNTDILIGQSAELFKVDLSGNPDVSQITFNVISIAMEGGQSYQFSCVGGTLSSVAGNTAALQFSSMTADTATITVSVTYRNNTYTRTAKVSKFYEAESGTQGLNNTTVFAYQRSATALTSNPGAVTYSFTARGITNGTLANGWLKTIPAGTDPLYVTVATASSVTATDDIAANEWSAPVVLVQNGLPGDPGVNNATVYIYQRTSTNVAPALPSATATYTFSPSGITGLNNGWASTISAASNGSYLWVSTATAANTTPTDSIPASEWATAQLLVQASATGPAGQRGNVQVARAITGGVWSDSEAALAISGAGYGTPVVRDVVTLYNNASGFSQAKYYDGDSWEILAAYFNGGLIVDGTVYTNALAAGSVTAGKIDARGLTIKDAAGNIILDAGKTLAQQASSNPNLVPGPMGWPTFYSGGYSGRNANPVFGDGAFLGLAAATTAGSYIAAESPPCGIPASSWVTVSFDASCDTSGTRVLSLNFFGTNVDTAAFQPTVNTTFTRYVWKMQMPNVADTPNARLRVWSTAVGNQILISNLKVELGINATPWCDNIITPFNADVRMTSAAIKLAHIDKASIGTLSAVNSTLGDVEVGAGGALHSGQTAFDQGNGFWLEGAGSGHGPRMSLGNSAGSRLICDPANNILQIVNPQYAPFSVTITNAIGFYSGSGTELNSNTMGTSIVGSANVKSILWSVSRYAASTGTSVTLSGIASEPTIGLQSITSTTNRVNFCLLTVTVTGKDGRVVSDSFPIDFQHNA